MAGTFFVATDKGHFETVALSSPLPVTLAGDTIKIEGGKVYLFRVGYPTYIAVRDIEESGPAVDASTLPAGMVISSITLFRSNPVAGIVQTISNIQVNETTGVITVSYANGDSLEYEDAAAIDGDIAPYESNPIHAQKLALLDVRRKQPDIASLALGIGTSCTIDGTAATPIQLSRPA